jgi:hypothetical protein
VSDPPVTVHVGELVLDGLSQGSGEAVAAAVRAELSSRLAAVTPGTPPGDVARAAEQAVADATARSR